MSKRKPPKNLRPYATPSGKKARYVDVQQPEAGQIVASNLQIDTPHIAYTTTEQKLVRSFRCDSTPTSCASGVRLKLLQTENHMDKPLGADWQWVLHLFDTNKDRCYYTALELRAEEALRELAALYTARTSTGEQ